MVVVLPADHDLAQDVTTEIEVKALVGMTLSDAVAGRLSRLFRAAESALRICPFYSGDPLSCEWPGKRARDGRCWLWSNHHAAADDHCSFCHAGTGSFFEQLPWTSCWRRPRYRR